MVDVDSVPLYPVLRARVSESNSGRFEGFLDDVLVADGEEFDSVRSEVMSTVAERAGRRQGAVRAIRVIATDAEGDEWPLVVTADGEVLESGEGEGQGEGRAFRWWWVALPVGVVILVTALAVVTVLARTAPAPARTAASSSAKTAPRPTPTQLPVPAPPGWSDVATWSAGAGEGSGEEASVAVAAGRVFVASGDAVTAHSATTGVEVWSGETDGPMTAGPAATTIDGRRAVVAGTSSSLYAWSPTTGKQVGRWDLGDGEEVMLTPTGPVVTGPERHARIVVDGHLVERVLPASATVVGPSDAGSLIVAGAPGRVWSVGDDRVAGSPVALEGPKGSTFVRVAGWTGSAIVAAFAPKAKGADASKVVLRAFDATASKPLWTSKAVPDSGDEELMSVASGGKWGTYGARLVDLRTGKVRALPEQWRTTTLGKSVGFGVVGNRVLSVTPEGVTAASAQSSGQGTAAGGQVTAPAAVADGRAFVVASDGDRRHLYALRVNDAGATSAAPSSTSAKKSAASKKRGSTRKPASSSAPGGTPAPKKSGSKSGGSR